MNKRKIHNLYLLGFMGILGGGGLGLGLFFYLHYHSAEIFIHSICPEIIIFLLLGLLFTLSWVAILMGGFLFCSSWETEIQNYLSASEKNEEDG